MVRAAHLAESVKQVIIGFTAEQVRAEPVERALVALVPEMDGMIGRGGRGCRSRGIAAEAVGRRLDGATTDIVGLGRALSRVGDAGVRVEAIGDGAETALGGGVGGHRGQEVLVERTRKGRDRL